VFNIAAVACYPAAGIGVVRRLLTDENAAATGVRFDCLTLAPQTSFRLQPAASSLVWLKVLQGAAKLKTHYTEGLSDRHSVFLPPAFEATLSTGSGVSVLRAEVPDAGRLDPQFATTQPVFSVSDYTLEPVLRCKNDGRQRIALVAPLTCRTTAIKVQMVIYPPGTQSAMHRHDGAESFVYLLAGRGSAETRDRIASLRNGDLIWFREGEWRCLKAAPDSEMRFLILYAPGVFRTAFEDPGTASVWSPTGLNINGFETARDARARRAFGNG